MPQGDDTDEALVRRFLAGEERAATMLFERLVPALRPRLRRRMASALRPRVGESDLMQNAFVSVLRRLPEFEDRGPGSFRRWLTGILDHKLVDEIRRLGGRGSEARAREMGLDALSEHAVPRARGPSPSRAAAAAEDRKRLRAAIERLAPDHRTVIMLIHERGLSPADAAATMGRSGEAIRKLYARALERLGACLAPEDRP